jgi:hypothetical protein
MYGIEIITYTLRLQWSVISISSFVTVHQKDDFFQDQILRGIWSRVGPLSEFPLLETEQIQKSSCKSQNDPVVLIST